MDTTAIDRFREATERVRSRAHELEVALVAARLSDRTWALVGGQVMVRTHPMPGAPDLCLVGDDTVVVHASRPAAELEPLLESLAADRLHFPGWPLDAPLAISTHSGGAPSAHESLFVGLDRHRQEPLPTWPLHRLSVVGEALYNEKARVARWLPSAPVPFVDLRDLGRDLTLATSLAETDRVSSLNVIALVAIRIANVTLRDGHVDVVVESDLSPGHSAVVAFVPVNAARAERQRDDLHQDAEADERGLHRTTVTFERPRSGGPAYVLLSLDGWVCDRRMVGLPDGRSAAHEVFDPESRWLREFLFSESPRAHQFEVGVTWLLHCLGFAAQNTGAKVLHGAPDVVAFDGPERALVCECTWTAPEPRKLTDVLHRAESIESRLREIGIGAVVVPVVVTAASMSDESVDALDAREKGVAVLTADDLEHWVERARHGDGPANFWRHVRELSLPSDEVGDLVRRARLRRRRGD